MNKRDKQSFYCRHCERTFTDAGVFLTHDCDAQPVTVTPAQRDVAAMLHDAPRCQVESDGDMLWA
jgi:hypothetical protein